MEAMTHDAKPTVTFPFTEHHHGPLAGRPVESQIGARGMTLTGPPAGCLTHE